VTPAFFWFFFLPAGLPVPPAAAGDQEQSQSAKSPWQRFRQVNPARRVGSDWRAGFYLQIA
jgi:hypothetical protein